MNPVIPVTRRENLFQEILAIIRQWPELDRRIFSKAHYEGHSAEAISLLLQMDIQEVRAILQRCDSRLHASLGAPPSGNFRKTSRTAA